MNNHRPEIPRRLKDIYALPLGEVLKIINKGSFEIIIGTFIVAVSSVRGTFLHYEGSPEYLFYHSLLNESGLFNEEELENLQELFVLYPMTYFYMLERPVFGNKCLTDMIADMEKRMSEAAENVENNEEEAQKYMNSQLIIDEVLRKMRVDNDALEAEQGAKSVYVGKVIPRKNGVKPKIRPSIKKARKGGK